MLRLGLRQQTKLHLARHGQVVLQPLLLLGDALVEAGVFDRDGNLRGECGDGALVVFVEVIGAGVLDVEHADDLALVDQRHRHLGARLGVDHVIARIFADVTDQHCAALRDRRVHQAAIERNLLVGNIALAEAHAILALQHLVLFVQQPDGEHVVVDQAPNELPDAFEQGVEIEDRG